MTLSSLPEETPATPGWVDSRIDAVFAKFGPAAIPAREAYAACLAGIRGAVDIDTGHDRCRAEVLAALQDSGADVAALNRELEALEAEISNGT